MQAHGAFDFPQPRCQRSGPAALFAIAEACRLEHYYKDALACYLRAAQAGYAPAQYDYATMLRDGIGTARDPEGAAFWYQQAANQGLAIAQYNLATRCGTGAD